VYDPVEDGVGKCGFFEPRVPGGYRELTDKHRGVSLVTIIDEVEQEPGLISGDWISEPLIEDN